MNYEATTEEYLQNMLFMQCESPIEQQFLQAYAELLDEQKIGTSEWTANYPLMEDFLKVPEIQPYSFLHRYGYDVIWIQPKVGKFRIDFVVGRIAPDIDWKQKDTGVESLRRLPLIAIECDGHDYHERTKEQAAKDRSRDRILLADGLRVVRFTGSEIYRDANSCAAEVSTIFDCMLRPRAVDVSQQR